MRGGSSLSDATFEISFARGLGNRSVDLITANAFAFGDDCSQQRLLTGLLPKLAQFKICISMIQNGLAPLRSKSAIMKGIYVTSPLSFSALLRSN